MTLKDIEKNYYGIRDEMEFLTGLDLSSCFEDLHTVASEMNQEIGLDMIEDTWEDD